MLADHPVVGFRDREEAGDLLAGRLGSYRDLPGVMVLGIPRGGVVVAARVALALRAPLDALVVRKLGVPGHEELAMGALTAASAPVLDARIVRQFGVDPAAVERVVARERWEVERRERAYRGTRPPVRVRGATVVIVDDGLATGSTMRAAVAALRQRGPARVVVAVPVAAPSTCAELRPLVDQLVCVLQPRHFLAVGEWYRDFAATGDEEVRALLEEAGRSAPPPAPTGVPG